MKIGKIIAGCLILWLMCGPKLQAAPAQDAESGSIEDQIIILYEEPQGKETRALKEGDTRILESEMLGGTVEVLTPAKGTDVDEMIRELEQSPGVAAAGRNKKIPLSDLPNDPDILNGRAWQFEAVGADQVWNAVTGENVVKVAVIDSGLNLGHEDLAGRCEIGYDYMEGTDASITDLVGHGTRVSGMVAATANNGTGIAGIAGASPVRVVAYRAGGQNASDDNLYLGYILAALEEITLRPDIQVINLSFGAEEPDRLEEMMVTRAVNAGKIVVAAAGNDGTAVHNYPASYNGVISVGAVSSDQSIAYFSNHNEQVDLCAPGAQIYTTNTDGGYVTGSGTSYAAPVVAGAAAVVKQRYEWMDARQVEAVLKETAQDLGTPGRDNYYGEGLIRLDQAVAESESMMPFRDVTYGGWYYDAVQYVYERQLMTGLDETTFAPDESLVRAQFAVILHRMNGKPSVEYTARFPDVRAGVWYTDAILWAAGQNVVTGYTHNGYFGPADRINREQMATMMYRYAGLKGYSLEGGSGFSRYTDAANVSDFAQEAMAWAVGNGIITGKYSETVLDPQGYATRAECATIIMRFTEKYGQ